MSNNLILVMRNSSVYHPGPVRARGSPRPSGDAETFWSLGKCNKLHEILAEADRCPKTSGSRCPKVAAVFGHGRHTTWFNPGPVRARGSPRPSGDIAHPYVTLRCDYREHLTPTQRRARQDDPPQRSLPPHSGGRGRTALHNATFPRPSTTQSLGRPTLVVVNQSVSECPCPPQPPCHALLLLLPLDH